MSGLSSNTIVLLPRRSLRRWAACALCVVLFSYLFILSLAAACVYLPFLLMKTEEFSGIESWLFFVAGVSTVTSLLACLAPRRDQFTPPGPQLMHREHPRLFAEIEQIASALGEPIPAEVYLLPKVNAWVGQRGGIFGIGGRRVMGIGLPLLQVLTISEFRALVAHEFGHYYAGDTRLWQLVYTVRTMIERNLGKSGDGTDPMAVISRLGARLPVRPKSAGDSVSLFRKLFRKFASHIRREEANPIPGKVENAEGHSK